MQRKQYLVWRVAFALVALPAYAHADPGDHEKMHAAFAACASQAGLSPPLPGQPPPQLTDAQRSALEACLKSMGVTPPNGPPPGPPPQESSQQQQLQ